MPAYSPSLDIIPSPSFKETRTTTTDSDYFELPPPPLPNNRIRDPPRKEQQQRLEQVSGGLSWLARTAVVQPIASMAGLLFTTSPSLPAASNGNPLSHPSASQGPTAAQMAPPPPLAPRELVPFPSSSSSSTTTTAMADTPSPAIRGRAVTSAATVTANGTTTTILADPSRSRSRSRPPSTMPTLGAAAAPLTAEGGEVTLHESVNGLLAAGGDNGSAESLHNHQHHPQGGTSTPPKLHASLARSVLLSQPPAEIPASAKNSKNTAFHAIFKQLPIDEFLVEDFSCALQKEILVQGRMYLTDRNVCFHAVIFGWVTSVVIPFADVTALDKRMTALIFPNAIEITAGTQKYFFASFLFRELAFNLLTSLWRKAAGRVDGAVSSSSSSALSNGSGLAPPSPAGSNGSRRDGSRSRSRRRLFTFGGSSRSKTSAVADAANAAAIAAAAAEASSSAQSSTSSLGSDAELAAAAGDGGSAAGLSGLRHAVSGSVIDNDADDCDGESGSDRCSTCGTFLSDYAEDDENEDEEEDDPWDFDSDHDDSPPRRRRTHNRRSSRRSGSRGRRSQPPPRSSSPVAAGHHRPPPPIPTPAAATAAAATTTNGKWRPATGAAALQPLPAAHPRSLSDSSLHGGVGTNRASLVAGAQSLRNAASSDALPAPPASSASDIPTPAPAAAAASTSKPLSPVIEASPVTATPAAAPPTQASLPDVTCECEHLATVVLDTIWRGVSPEQCLDWIYGETGVPTALSPPLNDRVLEHRLGCTNMTTETTSGWPAPPGGKRIGRYTMPLTNPMAPKQTAVTTTAVVAKRRPGKLAVTATTETPDVPLGSTFVVQAYACYSRALGGQGTRVKVSVAVKWLKSPWISTIRNAVESSSLEGQVKFWDAVSELVTDHVAATLASTTGGSVEMSAAPVVKNGQADASTKPPSPSVVADDQGAGRSTRRRRRNPSDPSLSDRLGNGTGSQPQRRHHHRHHRGHGPSRSGHGTRDKDLSTAAPLSRSDRIVLGLLACLLVLNVVVFLELRGIHRMAIMVPHSYSAAPSSMAMVTTPGGSGDTLSSAGTARVVVAEVTLNGQVQDTTAEVPAPEEVGVPLFADDAVLLAAAMT